MERKAIPVDPQAFRSVLIPIAAVLLLLAAMLGLPDVVLRLDPAYISYLTADLVDGGVYTSSAINTWMVIYTAVSVINVIAPAVLATTMIFALRGKPGQGMGMLSTAAQWGYYILNGIGIYLLCVLIYRLSAYIYTNIQIDEGVYLIYGMLITESVMVLLACILFFNLRRFMTCLSGSAVSIGYTLTCGKLDTASIPGFTATGFLLIGLAGILFACDQVFTITIRNNHTSQYYHLLVTDHLARWAGGISLLCSGVACILLFCYLRRYKRVCEDALFTGRLRVGSDT